MESRRPVLRTTKFWFSVFLLIILLALVIIVIGDPFRVLDGIIRAWPLGFLGVFFLYSIIMIIRIHRWKLLLNSSGQPVDTKIIAQTAFMSWAQNAVIPARLGEITRLYVLKKLRGIPYSITLSSIIIEKFFDLIGLILILGVSALFFWLQFPSNQYSQFALLIIVLIAVLLCLVVLFFIIPQSSAIKILKKLPKEKKIIEFYISFRQASNLMLNSRKLNIFLVFYSSFQWFIEALTIVWVGFIFGIEFNFTVLIFAAIIGYATYLIPFTPGSFGTFELFVGTIISLALGIAISEATLLPFVTHIIVVIYLSSMGLICGILLSLNKDKPKEETTEKTS